MRGHGAHRFEIYGLLFWGVLIVGAVLAARHVGGSGEAPRDTPLDVLKRRHAAGEITREQFEQMRRDLES